MNHSFWLTRVISYEVRGVVLVNLISPPPHPSWASLYSLYTNGKKSWIHLSVNSSCQGWIPTVGPPAMFKSKTVEVSWACKVIHLKRLLVINLQLGICFGHLGATKEEHLSRLKNTQILVDLHLKWSVKAGREDRSRFFSPWFLQLKLKQHTTSKECLFFLFYQARIKANVFIFKNYKVYIITLQFLNQSQQLIE